MSAISAAVERMTLPDNVNRDQVIEQILRRESIASTGTGEGVAIPHPQNSPALQLPDSVLTLAFLAQPIDFDAPDGKPVRALFVLLSASAGQHLRLLAHLGRILLNPEVQRAIENQLPTEQIASVFCHAEAAVSSRKPAPVAG